MVKEDASQSPPKRRPRCQSFAAPGSEELAEALAAYQTDKAQAIVDSEDGDSLPPALRKSFCVLINNLCNYE